MIKPFYSSRPVSVAQQSDGKQSVKYIPDSEDGGARDHGGLGGHSGDDILQRLRGAVLQRVPTPLPLPESQEEAAIPLL